jgi:hypothetical protein
MFRSLALFSVSLMLAAGPAWSAGSAPSRRLQQHQRRAAGYVWAKQQKRMTPVAVRRRVPLRTAQRQHLMKAKPTAAKAAATPAAEAPVRARPNAKKAKRRRKSARATAAPRLKTRRSKRVLNSRDLKLLNAELDLR